MYRTYSPAPGTYRDSDGRIYRAGYGGDRFYADKPKRPNWKTDPASEKQKRGIEWRLSRLASAKPSEYAKAVTYWQGLEDPTGQQASDMIDALERHLAGTSAPVAQAPADRINFRDITDGNYALHEDGDVIKFYRVKTTRSGYKKVQVRASDVLHNIDSPRHSVAILRDIVEAGLETSQMLFATELGQCWMCGRSLTDAESRARGTGPDCANK